MAIFFTLLFSTVMFFNQAVASDALIWNLKECSALVEGCSVKNISSKTLLAPLTKDFKEQIVILLSPGAHIEKEEGVGFLLITGEVFIETKSPIELRSEFAVVKMNLGLIDVARNQKHLRVKSFEGNQELILRGKKESFKLNEGFKVFVYGINSNGLNVVSFPESLRTESDYIGLANKQHTHIAQLKARLMAGLHRLQENVEIDSHLKESLVKRSIAEHKSQVLRQQQWRRAKEIEYQDLLRLVRQRNYLDEKPVGN